MIFVRGGIEPRPQGTHTIPLGYAQQRHLCTVILIFDVTWRLVRVGIMEPLSNNK